MKKLGATLFVLILALAFVVAQDNETGEDESEEPLGQIDKAYQCLQDKLDGKEQSSLSLQEAVFSTLALGSDDKLTEAIEDFEGTNCWPQTSCKLKDTAQVLLAYNRINKDTDDIKSWIISKNKTPTELTWYLQIDISSHEATSCDLTYDDNTYNININEDMTLSGSTGSCLSVSSSGFWLKVNNNCIDKTFTTSCEKDFITSLLYQRTASDTIFISPNTHSASELGETEETINSKCFSTGSSCDYEGSLWAALALDHLGNDPSPYLPYLLAMSDYGSNTKYFPSSFLYIFTNGNDQYNEVVQSQQQGQYWQMQNTPYNRFYDTSLAFLSLSGSSATAEVESAKTYLLDVQQTEGCWNNEDIRDTAFVLYSGWPRAVSGGGSGGPSGGTTETCESEGYTCVSGYNACISAGGNTLSYSCDSLNICCSVSPALETCAQQGGEICSASKTCSGTTMQTSDGTCCLGSCEEEIETENACKSFGGFCDQPGSCKSNEEEDSTLSCDSVSEVCCVKKDSSSIGGIWIWIISLIILIALVVVGIIYRKQLQLMIYKMRKKKGGPSATGMAGRRPPFPPASGGMNRTQIRSPMMRKPATQRAPMRRGAAQPRRFSKSDKELEDTLKKLKDMSK